MFRNFPDVLRYFFKVIESLIPANAQVLGSFISQTEQPSG